MSATPNNLWGFPIVEMDEAELIAARVRQSAVARHQQENKQRIAASMVYAYAAKEDSANFIIRTIRREIWGALSPIMAEFIVSGRNYNFAWSWDQSSDDVYGRQTLTCNGVAWLSSWRDCEIGELTNDPDLTKRNPMVSLIFINEENAESKEFQKVECDGAGVGFIRLR